MIDAEEFRRTGQAAVAEGTTAAAESALLLHTGQLLPDDLHEPWVAGARAELRLLHLDLLRLAGRWDDLVREDPADEQAHLALIRASERSGDVRGALRQFERMDQALRRARHFAEQRGAAAARADGSASTHATRPEGAPRHPALRTTRRG